ncbi:MAG: hypothetical protein M3O86_03780, partial [Actinomycetota bacterium]|nr:hypothetical protein [Actinomycetota bacterium]
ERTSRGVASALTAVRDHRDIAAWLGSVADATSRVSGLTAVGAARGRTGAPGAFGHDEEPEEPEEDDGVPGGSVADAASAGDLDGDGLDDVVVIDYDLDIGGVQLRALRGADGAELWRQPYEADGALAFPLGSDVDGDGIADLLRYDLVVHSEHFDEEEGDDGGAFELGVVYTWTVGLVSGEDGAERWRRDIDGFAQERGEFTSRRLQGSSRYELTSTNLAVVPSIARDVEGGLDVVLDEIDVDLTESVTRTGPARAHRTDDTYALRSATRVALLDGPDGKERATLVSPRGPTIAVLTADGDLTGDGADDLLWTRDLLSDYAATCVRAVAVRECPIAEGGDTALELELLDGATLASRWRYRTATPFGFGFAAGADLTGDGVGDVLAFTFDDSLLTMTPFRTAVLSGADGKVVWQRTDDDWLFPVGTGALGGGPGADLLTAAFVEDGDTVALRFDRIDGATGTVLSTSRYEPESAEPPVGGVVFGFFYAYGADDVDGDAVPEFGAGAVTGAFGADECEAAVPSAEVASCLLGPPAANADEAASTVSDVLVESGAVAGSARYREVVRGDVVTLFPLADLTGDGASEFAREVYDVDTGTLTTLALDLRGDDAQLWERRFEGSGYLVPVGDIDGGGGADLVEIADFFDDTARLFSVVTAVDGASGANGWSARSERRPQR